MKRLDVIAARVDRLSRHPMMPAEVAALLAEVLTELYATDQRLSKLERGQHGGEGSTRNDDVSGVRIPGR